MPISRASLLGGLAALGLAGAGAWAQQKPESILPPGFGEPTAPAPAPTASGTPTPRPSARPREVVQPLPPEAATVAEATPTPSPTPSPTPTQDPAVLAEYELPAFARRSLDTVGAIGPAEGGVAPDAFGQNDGRRLEIWMRRLRAPIASRWASIALRRALVSQIDTPAHVNGADFAAERAWLLLRMGEAVAARGVVGGVDNAGYTPKLYQVAMQTALATADPAAMCQLEAAARVHDPERAWVLAHAICTSLSGSPAAGQALVAAARRGRVARGVDLSLAQKVVGVGGQGRQAVTIEWDEVDQLTAWRWGLATATGVEVPDRLYGTAGQQVSGWRALAPAIPLARRVPAAETAALWGVLSSEALVDLYAAADEADDSDADQSDAAAAGVAADLRIAYADPSADARRSALERLWSGGATGEGYARLVLTARAAATVAPRVGDGDADRLVAAMLSAGLDRTALRWRDAVSEGGDAWAMLLLADPDAEARLPYRTLGRYAPATDAAIKQRFLFAGLAGLGRLSGDDVERGARELGVPIGRDNAWTRAIDRAAQNNEPGTAILLAAIGMQTRDWRGVPPDALFHIVAALRATGLEGPARMIAAEAIARA